MPSVPADVAITELANGRDERPGDRACIVERMATAGFSPKRRPARDWDEADRIIGRRNPSTPGQLIEADTPLTNAEVHLIKHIKRGAVKEGTTTADYLKDIAVAVRARSASVAVGLDKGEPKACAVARQGALDAAHWLVWKGDANFVVIYSARKSAVVTAHYRPASQGLAFMPDARQLKGL